MRALLKGLLVLLLSMVLVGCSGVSMDEHQEALDQLVEVEDSLSALRDEHHVILGQLAEVEDTLISFQKEYDTYRESTADWLELSETEKQSGIEIAKKETEIKNLEKEKTNLESQIENLKSQIEKLKTDIIKISGSPKTYPAGHLTAGQDFEVGRYKIYGGNSNFIVYSSRGDLRVNIILGTRTHTVSEYIYNFSNGDRVEAGSSFKMVPVE